MKTKMLLVIAMLLVVLSTAAHPLLTMHPQSQSVAISRAAILALDPPFTRVTIGSFVNDGGDSRGCIWGDYDNDGWLDLFVANDNGQDDFLYRNNRDGTFTKITSGEVVTSGGNGAGATWTDFDNDGNLDLFVANGKDIAQGNFLFRNNGDGTFTRITDDIIATDAHFSIGCAWTDYDNDGWLDVFVGDGFVTAGERNSLYRNNGDGSFNKITDSVATEAVDTDTFAWGDYNNDGYPDLFLPGLGQNLLYRNNGDGTFTKVTESGISSSGGTIGCAWGDYDNDGNLDLFVTNVGMPNLLYRNNGDGSFTQITDGAIVNDVALSFNCAWADYDNDGFLDLYVTTGARRASESSVCLFYHNNGDGTFARVTDGSIATDVSHSTGLAWGDYDNDGFLDLFVTNFSNQNNFLYRNNGNSNRWLKIKLVGSCSNQAAIGAKVRAKAFFSGAERSQLREINTGGGYQGNSIHAHFGLSDATNVEVLRIEWPSGTVQELHNVAVNQFLTLTEPPVLRAVPRPENGSFEFRLTGSVGFQYTLQVSSNLTVWTPWMSVTSVSRTIAVTDFTVNATRRFYRAVLLP